jgi:hypothetical protein
MSTALRADVVVALEGAKCSFRWHRLVGKSLADVLHSTCFDRESFFELENLEGPVSTSSGGEYCIV